MLKNVLAQSERYHRRVLYACAALLSVTILGIAALFGLAEYDQFKQDKIDLFVAQQERVTAATEQLTERVRILTDLYEGIWRIRANAVVPLRKYQTLLANNHGVALTDDDLTTTPFTIVSTLSNRNDLPRLGNMLRLLRELAPGPMIEDISASAPLSAFLYAEDGAFLAVQPPLSEKMRIVARKDVRTFITQQITPVEARSSRLAFSASHNGRAFWMPSPRIDETGEFSRRLVFPIRQDKQRIATIIIQFPEARFLRALADNDHLPGFFILGRQGINSASAAVTDVRPELRAMLQKNGVQAAATTQKISCWQSNDGFFIAQRIPGPDWIVIYAMDWKEILSHFSTEIMTILLLLFATLPLLWGGAVYFDRRIARPLAISASRLLEAKQFGRSIVATLPVGVSLYIPSSKQLKVHNAVAQHMLRNATPGMLASFFENIFHEKYKAGAPYAEASSLMERRWHSTDVDIDIGVVLEQIVFDGQPAWLFGFIDIGERKKYEALLCDAKIRSDLARQAKSMFLAITSHEIRTPLHGAIGNLELLEHTSLLAAHRARVTAIKHSFDHLLSLVNDILDLTKIESNALTIIPRPFHILDMVEHCAFACAAKIRHDKVRLQIIKDPVLAGTVMGDEHRCMQILNSLLNHAVTFTPGGEITLCCELQKQDAANVWVQFTVCNTSTGTPTELQSSLRSAAGSEDYVSQRFDGTSVSLLLSRQLTELMGGHITFSCPPDQGTTFTVALPFSILGHTEGHLMPLRGVQIELVCASPAWHLALTRQIEMWGATLHPSGAPLAPAIRITIERDDMLCDHGLPPSRGTVLLRADGPRAPKIDGITIIATSISTEALLQSILLLIGRTSASFNISALSPACNFLVADDDPVGRILIVHQLHVLGYQNIFTASDGQEALSAWKKNRPHVLVTDLGMPKLSGKQLIEEILKIDAQAAIIAITASRELHAQANLSDHVFQLQKPVLLDDLRRTLKMISGPSLANPPAQLNDADSFKRLTQLMHTLFMASWCNDRKVLDEAIRSNNEDKLRRRLHRIQGALSSLGRDSLAKKCAQLSKLSGAINSAKFKKIYKHFVRQLDQLTSGNVNK